MVVQIRGYEWMKKVLLLITILFVSVLTTACINNLAVQELNNKAKEYMDNGNTDAAICRLKSSLDLDSNMYETHYNLGVAYISAKKYDDAQNSLKKVLELNPSFVDTYYSLAIVNEEQAYNIINSVKKEEAGEEVAYVETSTDQFCESCNKEEPNEPLKPKKTALTDADKKEICDKFNEAIQNYNKYLTKKTDATDKDKVNERINFLNTEIKKYNLSENTSSTDSLGQ